MYLPPSYSLSVLTVLACSPWNFGVGSTILNQAQPFCSLWASVFYIHNATSVFHSRHPITYFTILSCSGPGPFSLHFLPHFLCCRASCLIKNYYEGLIFFSIRSLFSSFTPALIIQIALTHLNTIDYTLTGHMDKMSCCEMSPCKMVQVSIELCEFFFPTCVSRFPYISCEFCE